MKEKSDQLRYSAPAAKALLEMMEFMAKHDHRYTLSEIVESLNITSNSAFRIFKEMEQKGYVVKDPVTSTYELTPKLYYLGSSIRDRVSFIKTAQPYMESIKKATRETVLLTRFTHQYDTLVVDQLESSEPIKFVSTVGLSYDSYASAMGKAMLSMLDEKELGVYLQTHELVRKTEYTITDRDQLIRELADIRESRIAYDRGENLQGLTCIACPVFSSLGRLEGAIGISGPAFRINMNRMEQYAQFIKEQSRQLSSVLGYAQTTLGYRKERLHGKSSEYYLLNDGSAKV